VAQVIASTAGYYEVQEVEFGQVYKWRPEIVTVECACGERPNLTGSATDCEACSADHEAVIREWLKAARRLEEGKIHPWRYAGHDEEAGLPY
jgi:hypothetical protein